MVFRNDFLPTNVPGGKCKGNCFYFIQFYLVVITFVVQSLYSLFSPEKYDSVWTCFIFTPLVGKQGEMWPSPLLQYDATNSHEHLCGENTRYM